MTNYLSLISIELGIPLWALIVLIAWTVVWKLVAFWKSARNNHLIWFVVFAVINTFGLLEILYIFVFSKSRKHKTPTRKRKLRRKRR